MTHNLSFLTAFEAILKPINDALEHPRAKPCLTSPLPSALNLALAVLLKQLEHNSFRTLHESKHKQDAGPSWLVLAESEPQATEVFNDLQFCCSLFNMPTDGLIQFPQWASLPYQSSLPPANVIAQRARAFHRSGRIEFASCRCPRARPGVNGCQGTRSGPLDG